MLDKLLTFENVIDISRFMVEHGYDKKNVTIETTVTDKKIFEKLNEDFFYRLGGEGDNVPPAGETICVNVGDLTFRYCYKEGEE